MDYRKIIEFGKSSYVVSLPKPWLIANKLKKGDVVCMDPERSKLVIYPSAPDKEQKPRKITIDVTNMTKSEIRIQLVSKYVRNFNEITLTAKNMKSRAKDIRNIIHDMMALEVIEEDANQIVTKAFLNMEEISPVDVLKKMDKITREMIADSKNHFQEDKYLSIKERDPDVNRLSYLLFRTMRYLQNNPTVAKKHRLTHGDYLSIWVAGTKVEKIADQTKWITKLLRLEKFQKAEQEEFQKLYSTVEKYYLDSMEAFYAADSDAAFRLMSRNKRLIKQCRDFHRQNWNYEWVAVLVEKLKTMVGETKALLSYVCDRD